MCSEPLALPPGGDIWQSTPSGDVASGSGASWEGVRAQDVVKGGGREAASPLPCQDGHNSNGEGYRIGCRPQDIAAQLLQPRHAKMAYVIAYETERFIQRHGVERVGFLTLTFAEPVTLKAEAARRFNRLRTGVLAERYSQGIAVWERQKNGRWHVHCVVVLEDDIRTGVDFAAIANGVYQSAGTALRREWAFWRKTAKAYGFGRTELLPVKTTGEAMAKYLSKYLAKHIDHRLAEDKRVRVLAFWGYRRGTDRKCTADFAWNSKGARAWRETVKTLAEDIGAKSLDELTETLGPRWAYMLAITLGNASRPGRDIRESQPAAQGREVALKPAVRFGADVRDGMARQGDRSLGDRLRAMERRRGTPDAWDKARVGRSREQERRTALRLAIALADSGVSESQGAVSRATESRTPLPKRSDWNPRTGGVKEERGGAGPLLDAAEHGLQLATERGGRDGTGARQRKGRGGRLAVGSWAAYSCPQDNV